MSGAKSSGSKGRTARTRGVNARLLASSARNQHGDASVSDRVSAPTPEGIRRYLDALLCPFCGKGPYKVPVLHITQTHGIDKKELREMAQVPLSASFTAPDTFAAHSARAKANPQLTDEVRAKSKATRQETGRRKTAAMVNSARRALEIAREERNASSARAREELINTWERDDKTYMAVARIADQLNSSRKSIAERLRYLGIAVPDGHAGTDLKRQNYPAKRHHCDFDECTREHVARGLCRYHYNEWRIANGRVPECSIPDCQKPIVGKKLCSTHYARSRA